MNLTYKTITTLITVLFSNKYTDLNTGQDINQADLSGFVFLLLPQQDIQQYFLDPKTLPGDKLKVISKVSEIRMLLNEQVTLRSLVFFASTQILRL